MKIEDEILINQYGQDLVSINFLLDRFERLDIEGKKNFLNELINLIAQSKVVNSDIQAAIENSNLKVTYTPCVMLRNGISNHLLDKFIQLPSNELSKVFILFLSLFRIGYNRRFNVEKNNPNKWWYWDLSDEKKVELILERYET